jgi:VanZ family protein
VSQPSDARRAWRAWLLAAVWAALIIALSSIPAKAMPESSLWDFDKLAHAGVYAVLGALVLRAWWLTRLRAPGIVAVAFAMAGGFGVVDELYQRTTPGRHSSIGDVIADCIGALVGSALAWVILRRCRSVASQARTPE